VGDREVLWNLGNAALQLGADDAQRHFYDLALSRAREAGAVTAVVYALERLCFSHYLAGDVGSARSAADEALSLASSVGQPALTALPTAWLTLLSALQGREDYDDLLDRLEQVVARNQLGILAGPVHDVARWARALRAAAAGDSDGAMHQLSRFRVAPLSRMAFVERVDAAVRAGDSEQARSWVEELAAFADATGRPWAVAAVAYGRAVTAPEDGAVEVAGEVAVEEYFQQALSQYTGAVRPLDVARVELAYGEWLRRGGRRIDARAHLRRALDTFVDIRAAHLADRATQELRASGETARKRDVSTLVQLTPMELQVAQLVATGLSNKDVAAQCWVSPRTVAFHLRNVFTKAGITSRGELAQLDLA
jgi:DNA-binding CsgD family transcriptional regulator